VSGQPPRFGAASLDMAFVAAGRLDGYWERNLKAWDVAAGIIMIREAGGVVGDIHDGDLLKTSDVVCGNEFVHGELVKVLKAAGLEQSPTAQRNDAMCQKRPYV
jgi:myo-inositol-1(or 4)-monophosphatase